MFETLISNAANNRNDINLAYVGQGIARAHFRMIDGTYHMALRGLSEESAQALIDDTLAWRNANKATIEDVARHIISRRAEFVTE
jgi:hypothetical protein